MTPLPRAALLLVLGATASNAQELTYPVVDTMQDACFDLMGGTIDCRAAGEALYGQDAQYSRLPASYADNGDGTVLDTNTGLVWQKTPH